MPLQHQTQRSSWTTLPMMLLQTLANSSGGVMDGLLCLQETLKHVSKGISDSTESEYKRLILNCDTFLREHGLLWDGESLFSHPPRQEAAYLIVAWIMDACDSVKLDGTNKPSTNERGLYGHAQKMRAAMTYAFGRLQGLGNLPWHESELHSGQMLGNPLVSVEVSSYMCSLRRRKVQAGEVAVSARAITSHILNKMYHFNHRPENWAILDYRPRGRGDGSNIKPFWLWIMPMEAHLCAVQAIAKWITASGIMTGYLFQKFASSDRIAEANQPLVATVSHM
ncbi:hypothetical protein EV702DRAFT_1042431 [Suillus placidus]|uniref:Uncharacterized protein n=1 Tax=Suillus placidus TaxID=48579 RepID=A0A9P7A2L0_9AGAM|nr:hypothetical protein EV702DRAFT_1042431 [Suillus placidus]